LELSFNAKYSRLVVEQDLTDWLPNAQITSIDTNSDMIASAQGRPELTTDRVHFFVKSGEQAAEQWPETLDVVWMRFVVVHVPNPVQLIQAAVDCLKPHGTLLIEDCNAEGAVSDPPLFANTLIHRAHMEASLKLGADVGSADT
jgi:2-polyprenyl-3-methyl-5-hydroxy-6-metoxy-1,4-benzoquinol methylase